MTSSDGRPATVTLQIDDHPGEARPYVIKDIADRLRVEKEMVLTVLEEWTPEQLRAHLEQFTAEQLRPPAYRS